MSSSIVTTTRSSWIAEAVEARRLQISGQLDQHRKSELGQFFTPIAIARLVASKFGPIRGDIRLLDAGAGIGCLTTAFVERILEGPAGVTSCELAAYEIDPTLTQPLQQCLEDCCRALANCGIPTSHKIYSSSFLDTAKQLQPTFFADPVHSYTHAILNPPYKKIQTDSTIRKTLSAAGIETSNLYSAFVWLALLQLQTEGELVALTPRSFCNGAYFRPFRQAILTQAALDSIHLFESRTDAFVEDEVLQENIIFHLLKSAAPSESVTIYQSAGKDDESITIREGPFSEVVHPADPEKYIHIVTDDFDAAFRREMAVMPLALEQLGLMVSTGPVVDFRLKGWLQSSPDAQTVPLLYPESLQNGRVVWPPARARKPTAIIKTEATKQWLTPAGWYVVTRRFSAKEERRRIVAAICPLLPYSEIGIENHLNFFHAQGKGLEPELAKGLAGFLNSSLFDQYFRQYSGHTQVNATDLRATKYPTREALLQIGKQIPEEPLEQSQLDSIISEVLQVMDDTTTALNGALRLEEALDIIKQISAPKAQQNERSALTLLALANITANDSWQQAQAPCRGITEMMDWFRVNYGKNYAPNTRETVRRQTIHQFLQIGFATQNPEHKDLAVNSPKNCYQLTSEALALIRSYGSDQWDTSLRKYLAHVVNRLVAAPRDLHLIPVTAPDGSQIELTKGGQNPLIAKIIEEFCPRFTPGGQVLYAGDAGQKFNPLGEAKLQKLGLKLDKHGKMPDVIVHYLQEDWLVLIEATTSHGPVDLKRHNELKDLFAGIDRGLVFVTAFSTRREMTRYLAQISWETEVWVAEEPEHLIHFNGVRFLGPH